jgi:diguanylate cyclase (GGDEF)-like protein
LSNGPQGKRSRVSIEVKTAGMIVVIFVVLMAGLYTQLDTTQLAILGVIMGLGLALVIFVLDIWVYRPVNGLIRRSRRRLGSQYEHEDPHDRDELKELEFLINTIIKTFTEVQTTSQASTSRSESDLLRLQTYNRQLVDVNEIGQAINAALPYDDTVKRILERSKTFLKADFAAMISLEKNTRAFELQDSVGVKAQDTNIDCCLYTSDCPVRLAMTERDIVRSADHTCTLFPKTMRSQLIVPLAVEGVGEMAVLLTATTNESFEQVTTNVLSTLQGHMESALGNAKKYDGIRTQVSRDHLTRLYNRRFFMNRADELLKISLHRSKQPLSFVMLDIDHFKNFNDTYGHQTGDRVLQVVASEMQRRVRKDDICSRYGGEEFAMLLPNATGDAATSMADRMRAALAETRYTGLGLGVDINITVSMGVATCPRDATTIPELIELADKALYQAKAGGRNRVVQWAGEPV